MAMSVSGKDPRPDAGSARAGFATDTGSPAIAFIHEDDDEHRDKQDCQAGLSEARPSRPSRASSFGWPVVL